MKHLFFLKKNHPVWQLPLFVVFLCFGILLMAQYNTHQAESSALENQSSANLAMIIKGLNDNNALLQEELAASQAELEELQAAVESGESLNSTVRNRIQFLRTAIGGQDISGPGIILSLPATKSLMYVDLIDIVNDIMNSGAEAVSINGIRFTAQTQISEISKTKKVADSVTGAISYQTVFIITVDGKEMESNITVMAIGDPDTLQAAMEYPGGILTNLRSIYGVNPSLLKAEQITIPAAQRKPFSFAKQPDPEPAPAQ